MNKKYYNWEEFLVDIKKIHASIEDEFDCIIGISKGGIIPVGIMSQLMMNDQVYLVSYRGGGEGKEIESTKDSHPDLKNKKVLLIDDVSDNGNTLLSAKTDLEKLGNQVTTACLHYKSHTKLIPDYFASQENDWIVYPWEIE
jgi:uncharacterized protein